MSTEREARYAEAMDLTNPTLREHWSRRIRAVMAVADAEQAELRAEVRRWREMWDRHGKNDLLARAEAAEAELAALRTEVERLKSPCCSECGGLPVTCAAAPVKCCPDCSGATHMALASDRRLAVVSS